MCDDPVRFFKRSTTHNTPKDVPIHFVNGVLRATIRARECNSRHDVSTGLIDGNGGISSKPASVRSSSLSVSPTS